MVQSVDIILVHIYPYWDGISIDDSAEYVFDKWRLIEESFPDKVVIIGEPGWPTEGDKSGESVPSEENQEKFLSRFLRLNQTHNTRYFLFEVYDEKWKDKYEGTVGSHWGLYYSNGSMKPLLNDLAPHTVREGLERTR
ncbi:glycosyl hydrolase family 17 protein [Chloroflexota bacterium]